MDRDILFFETPDYFAVTIIVLMLKLEPEYFARGKKTFARWPRSAEIYQLLDRYLSGELEVKAIQFAETMKRIRGEMIRFRERAAGESDDQ